MVAQNIRLPNIRKIIVPDLGYTIVDADLAGADAQVVAWEAGDEKLKEAFRKGLKVHIMNARDVWPDETKNMTDAEIKATGDNGGMYYEIKRAVHGTNYGGSPDALTAALGWSRSRGESFQERWFFVHPEIREWHRRVERYLEGLQCWKCDNRDVVVGRRCELCGAHNGRTVKNAFGFRRMYFDRIDGSILPQALAWGPQSTVAFAVDIGWTAIRRGPSFFHSTRHGVTERRDWSHLLIEPRSHEKWGHIAQFLVQVHDSIVFQVRHRHEDLIPEIVHDLGVRIPYPDDPLIIPMSYAMSRTSWGDCK